jgi:hypothetical protein
VAAEHAAKNMIYRSAYAQAAFKAANQVKTTTKAASVDNFKGTSINKNLSKADLAAIRSQKIHDSVAKEVEANREQRAALVPDPARDRDAVKKADALYRQEAAAAAQITDKQAQKDYRAKKRLEKKAKDQTEPGTSNS